MGSFAQPSSPESAVPSRDPLSVLKALAEASAIFIALTFIGGWSYLASYYRTFGLNPLELDVSVPVASTIAVYVLYKAVWPLFIAGAVIVIFAILAVRSQMAGRGLLVATVAALLLTAAVAGTYHGRHVAGEDMLADSAALPNVAFASRVKNPEPSCVDFNAYGSADCKLLLHFKNTYYFFQPVPKKGVGSINLYMLSDSDVVGIHLQRGLDQNARIE